MENLSPADISTEMPAIQGNQRQLLSSGLLVSDTRLAWDELYAAHEIGSLALGELLQG